MIANKTKKTFWREREILLKECRTYNKTVLELQKALDYTIERYRQSLGIGLLMGFAMGLVVGFIINYWR